MTTECSKNDIDRAWQYHKEADTLFHSRLTSFVTSQSFLVTGYMVSFSIPNTFPVWYSILLRALVAVLAMGYSASFFAVCNYLYLGMQELKHKYLYKDPIYETYYFHRHTSEGPRGEGKLGHIIPRWLPLGTLLFWFLVLCLELWRIAHT